MTLIMMRHAVVQGSRTVEFHKSQDACRRSRVLMFQLLANLPSQLKGLRTQVSGLHRPTKCWVSWARA